MQIWVLATVVFTMLAGCQTTGSQLTDADSRKYASLITKNCIWTNTYGHKKADERMNAVSVSSVVDGTVDGQSGWKRVQFFEAGKAANLYVDTNANRSYCGMSFKRAGYTAFRVSN